MGYYIQTPTAHGKARYLIANHGARSVPTPAAFPNDEALVCVVDNVFFEAAAYCYSSQEYEDFRRSDGRRKQWLVMPIEVACELSGYRK